MGVTHIAVSNYCYIWVTVMNSKLRLILLIVTLIGSSGHISLAVIGVKSSGRKAS